MLLLPLLMHASLCCTQDGQDILHLSLPAADEQQQALTWSWPQGHVQPESDAEVAYARLGALCQAIKNELQNDLTIHDSSVLPAYVNLPQVTAAEYSQVRSAPLTWVPGRADKVT